MATEQPELAMETSIKTEEVNRERFDELAKKHLAGEIRMIALQAPSRKDRWLWKVTYRILKV